MKVIRLSDALFLLLSYLLIWVFLLGCDAVRRNRESLSRIALESSIVRDYGLTDLCLATEARYTRHPSMADLHAPLQDHPLALEHYPSGSLIPPPSRFSQRTKP